MTGLSFSKSAFLKKALKKKNWAKDGKFEQGAEHFLKSYFDDAEQNDPLRLDVDDLIDLAADFWEFGRVRKVGATALDVKPVAGINQLADRYDMVQLITDDRRFLVDSIIGSVSDHGIDVMALFHPITAGFRDGNGRWRARGTSVTESMIQVIIPRQTTKMRAIIKKGIEGTLEDLSRVISDFDPMIDLLESSISQLSKNYGDVPKDVLDESIEFLEWLRDGNFVLLGTRTYDFQSGKSRKSGGKGREFDYADPKMIKKTCLGVLQDKTQSVLRATNEPSLITKNTSSFLHGHDPVTVAKSNLFSRVHRRVRMDYVSIKVYSQDGLVRGETRLVGLFTSDAYERSPKYVPLVRRKIEQVLHRYGAHSSSHNAKRLDHVLSTYPRDELFQISEDELYRIATGIAQAFDRPRARIFVRHDQFNRFVSILVYVPREHYSSRVRSKIGIHLRRAYDGRVSAFYPQYSDSPLARVHFIIGLDPTSALRPDIEELERQIAEIAQPWVAGITSAAEELQDVGILDETPKFKSAFTPAYQAAFSGRRALKDIQVITALSENHPTDVRVYRRKGDAPEIMRVKFYSLNQRLEPSNILPIFSNMALHVAQDTGYPVRPDGGNTIWIHDYEMKLSFEPKDRGALKSIFRDAFLAVWHGRTEDDGFNALILPQIMDWRRIAFIRLLARYRKQSGLDPSENVQIEALQTYPAITAMLIELFTVKFDPALKLSLDKRKTKVELIKARINKALETVVSLDHDRVLRRLAQTLLTSLRTNFFVTDELGQPHPFISLKINSQELTALPAPRPYREIFVWSPRVEGVHLRFGPVARGGLRWSDRRDDFRTEVLGLVKAQQVKNAVIVPVGSKGGFYPKKLPTGGDRDAFITEGIAAYTQFISGLLDVTDNYAGAKTVAPKDVVCWDDPDPYLVVAADKGTATFSDIANGIAIKYGFWLGDAFASGGSVGYDHKAMGITAKGGWEAVKRHFREIGKDIQSEEFDVIGVGDMSGDVFGNGMLLSERIRLQAAFDHRDIFVDPTPNAAKTFKERERMFNTPRTTWQDFNKKLISKGGGVFSRSAKSIKLSPEIKDLTGLSDDEVTPNALIKALLKAPCELLWFGGIGTYIKSKSESHPDVRDKANDAIRINGHELRAKVIGEGANLGVTQAGRIEFAQSGGRVNTDAVDNSAGVDCSDNEVNIKILLSGAIEAGELKESKRVKLLESMTDDVSDLVLKHNYDQTGALTLAASNAREDHAVFERFMETLEAEGRLDRAVEGLPPVAEMQNRYANGGALVRPEIAVLNAYAKIKLYDDLMATNIASDPYFDRTLTNYFPKAVQGFSKALSRHRLRKEIINSRLCNLIVDVGGPVFMSKIQEQTNAEVKNLATAFSVAYEVLQVEDLIASIKELDNKVPAEAQMALIEEVSIVMQRVIGWLIRHPEKGAIDARVARRMDSLANVDEGWVNVLSSFDSRRVTARIGRFVRDGIPEDLARDVSLLRARAGGFDVVELSEKTGLPVKQAAELFYDIGGRFKIDRLRALSLKAAPKTHWENLAQKRIDEDFYSAQAGLALAAAKRAKSKRTEAEVGPIIRDFVLSKKSSVLAYDEAYSKINSSGGWTLAKFSLINTQLRELLGG